MHSMPASSSTWKFSRDRRDFSSIVHTVLKFQFGQKSLTCLKTRQINVGQKCQIIMSQNVSQNNMVKCQINEGEKMVKMSN